MKKLLSLIVLLPVVALGLVKPQGYVSDFAGVLRDRNSIEYRISEFHQKTGTEIAVVTVQSLEGQAVEEYAHNLFKQWGIGRKGVNNGVLILVAPTEHKVRIEVGYGLEGTLNDSFCGRVIRDDMLPEFKKGNFSEGIQYALTTIFHRIGG